MNLKVWTSLGKDRSKSSELAASWILTSCQPHRVILGWARVVRLRLSPEQGIKRHLCSSSDSRTLLIPFVKTKAFGQRALSFTGPTRWNLLPYGLWHSKSSPAFKTALKNLFFFRSSSLLYLLDAVWIILVFVPGVEYSFLCVYNVMWGLFEGMYLNIVVIVTCFVASNMLSLLINVFICK